MTNPWLQALGYTGQALFAGRVLMQWIASERQGRSVVPRGYWEISLVASALVLTYTLLVRDVVFVLSTIPGAFVAARNLRIVGPSSRRRLVPYAVPLLGLVAWATFSKPTVGPPVWAAIGLTGSLLWGGRHLIQWWISERRGVSVLPGLFWVLSLAGSLLLVAYAITLRNGVMIAGYAFGCVPYLRNLVLIRRVLGRAALLLALFAAACGPDTDPRTCDPKPSFPAGIELGPQVAQAEPTRIVVAWRTTGAVTAALDIDGRTLAEDGPGVEHVFHVTGLRPAQAYPYRLVHDGVPVDASYTLETAGDGGFRFAVIGDSGSGCAEQFEVARALGDAAPDLVLHTGDIAYLDGSRRDWFFRYFVPYAELLPRIPFYLSVGDHDVLTDDAATMLGLVYQPGNERYYSFDRGDCHFVALDTNLSLAPGSEQLAWLAADLAAAQSRWTIAYFHRPPYSASRHGSEMHLRNEIVPLFDAHGVDLAFSGNDHNYERTHPLRGGTIDPSGTVYVVTGGGGQTLYSSGTRYFTAASRSVFHAVVVDVEADRLTLRAIDRSGATFDSCAITKAE